MKHVLFPVAIAAIMAFAIWHPAPRPAPFAAIAAGDPIPAPSASPGNGVPAPLSAGNGVTSRFSVRHGKHRKTRRATRHHRSRRSAKRHRHQRGRSSLHQVDLNRATAQALGAIPGLGSGLADRIVAFRALNGPFDDLDDLLDVSGMTAAHIDRATPYLTVR